MSDFSFPSWNLGPVPSSKSIRLRRAALLLAPWIFGALASLCLLFGLLALAHAPWGAAWPRSGIWARIQTLAGLILTAAPCVCAVWWSSAKPLASRLRQCSGVSELEANEIEDLLLHLPNGAAYAITVANMERKFTRGELDGLREAYKRWGDWQKSSESWAKERPARLYARG